MNKTKSTMTLARLFLVMPLILLTVAAKAQTIAVRNNLLYDATLSPNLGFDLCLSSKWTAGGTFAINAWDINKDENKKWRHLLVEANARRWLSDSLWYKGYVEGDIIYSHYNVGNTSIPFGIFSGAKERRLQGDLVALGAKYGYSWILSRRWRLEAEGGVAVGYAWFDEYECPTCGKKLGEGNRIFLLPQLGINVVLIIN